MDMKKSHFSRVWILILLIFVLLSCDKSSDIRGLIQTHKNVGPTPKLPTKAPTVTITVGWVDTRVKFLDSDCPGVDLPKPTTYVEMGSLTCNYSIDGGSEGMSIRQVNDFNDLQDQFNSSKDYGQQQITSFMNKPNAHLTTISPDRENNLYLITFDGDKSATSTQIPLCVYAGGNQIVDNKFLTGFLLYACSIDKNANDYQSAFLALVESAMSAIDRAQSAPSP
jgi:hypothetical protein